MLVCKSTKNRFLNTLHFLKNTRKNLKFQGVKVKSTVIVSLDLKENKKSRTFQSLKAMLHLEKEKKPEKSFNVRASSITI